MENQNPIICALDTASLEEAIGLCKQIKTHVCMIKLGLEFFNAQGAHGVKAIRKLGLPVFLDLKLHDIPNTVSKALAAVLPLDIAMLTIHTSGGVAMMQATMDAVNDFAAMHEIPPPLVMGVTILTSLDTHDLEQLGYKDHTEAQVTRLAKLAQSANIDGVVCSAHEIEPVKTACGKAFKTVVPGIRPTDSRQDDQKRTLTPREAIAKGADYLVIGRPITQSHDPAKAAAAILQSL